ncbi:hypothetical protein RR46_09340 [Papilio xuthus]|uniref:Cuticular protein n=1 Tax=Papilio xuthus TaxID=66420 RepID=A0A194PWP2_PAPXU|nr:hypothetical protein RR46_09340 [Papilio xuthus]
MMKLVVLSCLLAAASASLIAPLAYSAPYAYPAALAYSAPLAAPYNYRGPLSLAPGQSANILAADGRPLDTLDVNLNRAAHYTAKALDNGFHLLKKRSVITPVIDTCRDPTDRARSSCCLHRTLRRFLHQPCCLRPHRYTRHSRPVT